ncbi:MAG TPA: phytoene desaturase family protein, partial [Pseudonocardiaceae bacterium]|nr:phytoene desaturase family protein [Pseudonocardiaceae bacterium]
VGGLCAAARLATAGHRVTVCEAAERVGGKLGSRAREGFRFDTGPSLLTWPEVFEDTFAAVGTRLDEHLELERVTPAFRYRFADGTWITVPNGPPQQVAEAFGDQLGGTAAADWRAFCAHAQLVWHAVRGPFLSQPLSGPIDLLRHSRRLRDLRRIAPWRTLRGTGARFLRDPRLRTLLDRYATYSGSNPRRVPAALAVVPWLEQTQGVWYVRGGLYRLAEALSGCVTTAGAVIRLGCRVTRVCVSGGRVAGVRLADGERLAADVVVCNADATRLYRELLDGPETRRPLRRLARATASLSGFVLLLGLRHPAPVAGPAPDPAPAHHTVLFPADYDAEFDSIFGRPRRRPVPVADPAVYLGVPDDPAVRPDDRHEAWFVLVNAPRQDPLHGVDWEGDGLAERYATRVLDVMAQRGVDVRARIVHRDVRTPADLQRETGAPGGSIYGTSSNGPAAAFLRPANRSRVPGLFLVGGSAHPGGGLPLVAQSAAIVARLVGRA